jgi:hypothetical protein
MQMKVTDRNACFDAFNNLCDELRSSDLVGIDDCQYWLFERGYQAALEKLISNMAAAAKPQNRVLPDKKSLAGKIAAH